MSIPNKVRKRPPGKLQLPVSYDDVLKALRNWPPQDLEQLITDVQKMAQEKQQAMQRASERATGLLAGAELPYTDEEVDAIKWQHLVKKYDLLDLPVPRVKASLDEMLSIIPPDTPAPTDEEVEEILMQARLERLDRNR